MPRALAAGPLLFIWSLPRAQACFLSKKQMEEQKRVKATKPYWMTIVLPAWGTVWEPARLFVRAPSSMREQHSSRLRIPIPISSTASWSCPEDTTQLPPALLQWVHVATRAPKFGAHHFLQMRLTCTQGQLPFPMHTGLWLPCWAHWVQTTAQQICSSLDYP